MLLLTSTRALLSSTVDSSTHDSQYPLHHALRLNDTAKALSLLATDPSLARCSDAAGITPLHVAAFNGNYQAAVAILERGGNLHAVNCFKRTPLHDAARAGSFSIVQLFLYHGANPNAQDHKNATPLIKATHFNSEHPIVVQALLRYNARPELAKNGGFTPLHRAAYKQQVKTVELLVAHNAPVNAQNMFGRTPLHDAVGNSSNYNNNVLTITRCLLNAGASLKIKDGEERTPLFVATQSAFGNSEVIKELLRRGANPNTAAQSITPLHVASSHAYSEAAEALCKAGANMNAQNFLGNTPLHDALNYYYSDRPYDMYNWSFPIIILLLKKHARTDIPNKNGDTVQMLDRKGGWTTTKIGQRYHRSDFFNTVMS